MGLSQQVLLYYCQGVKWSLMGLHSWRLPQALGKRRDGVATDERARKHYG